MSNESTQQVVVRFAPSPTGLFHVGSVRTALFNYLFAKKSGGKFLLRIEDTDKERSKKEYEDDIMESLKWLGFEYEGLCRQSERTEIYTKHLAKLIESGAAYISKETPKEEGQRAEVVRFKNPNKEVSFTDLIRGEIKVDTTDLGDFVIAKSPSEPLYHLAVVVDDHESGITHVIRGEDHISNTPRQILIQEAIGAVRPLYAHLPLIFDEKRAKLSKRKHGEIVSLHYYREKGYMKEALINFMALLGWNPGTDQEIFSLDELVAQFDLGKVQKGGAIFNTEKLDWINREHFKRLPLDTQKQLIAAELLKEHATIDHRILDRLMPELITRITKLGDVKEMKERGELDYYMSDPVYDAHKLPWKDSGTASARIHLEQIRAFIEEIPEAKYSGQAVKDAVWAYAETKGRGEVLWPMRFALSGKEKSPDPFSLADILGKTITLNRLSHAIRLCS